MKKRWIAVILSATLVFSNSGMVLAQENSQGLNNGNESYSETTASDTLCVRRGNKFYINHTLEGGDADLSFTYGRSSDEVLVGDWDGNGTDTLAMRRSGNTYFISNSIENPDYNVDTFTFGRAGDEVYAGTWQ